MELPAIKGKNFTRFFINNLVKEKGLKNNRSNSSKSINKQLKDLKPQKAQLVPI